MDKISAERISQIINEEPFVFEVDVKKRTFIQKLFRQKKTVKVFSVKPPSLGTLIKVSAEIGKIQGVDEMFQNKDIASILKHLCVNGDIILNILAIYIGNSFGLKNFLKQNITTTESANLLMKLIEFSDLQDFMTTIILTKGMSLMKTEEIIAPPKEDKEKTSQGLSET